ncbi:MAG: squalene--hopene cyclase [Rhodospirillaceae bacterium TMED8]|nr:MAG: squalene--hopene cyclase [Rhodospirillaceae bacterium TMED8]
MDRRASPAEHLQASDEREIDGVIEDARNWLKKRQATDGHWAFELEADATIPAEYIFLNHFLGTIDNNIESKLAIYLRNIQEKHGGWPLYHDGDFDMSASVKAYYALKMTGDAPEAAHMARARAAILVNGGAAKANVFTRIALALFEQVPWHAVPVIRVEALLLPRWAPFHMDKVSYWSRTVMVPLLVLASLRPKAANPRQVNIQELFLTPPAEEKEYLVNPTGHWLGLLMLGIDRLAHPLQRFIPGFLTRRAIEKAMHFVIERLNSEDGLGGIFPAMANAVMAFEALGYDRDHLHYQIARDSIDKLLVFDDESGYCQPCLSPVWDTGLAAHALLETGNVADTRDLQRAGDWLVQRQILDVAGDWAVNARHLRPGGWAFQYSNDHYPDVDDTAVVVMALHRLNPERYRDAINRGAEWIIGMQSRNGGWGAFDIDNEYYFLQHIPFADHGALLDPPTADVSARCLSMLAQLGYDNDHKSMSRVINYLKREQERDGSWFGRWGNNYVYGTWSVLCALNAAGENMQAPYIRKAVDWLKGRQQADGGWGEDCASYWQHRRDDVKSSTPSQTSWAVLGLMAAGEEASVAVKGGIDYLLQSPREDGKWQEEYFNAVGFPRVFYLRYHGYSAFFPLWTLARYRNVSRAAGSLPKFGI